MKAWQRMFTALLAGAVASSLGFTMPSAAQQITRAEVQMLKQKYLQEFLQCSDMTRDLRDALATVPGQSWSAAEPGEWYVVATIVHAMGCNRDSPEAQARLRAALDFIEAQPSLSRNDSNWWHKEIGVPRALAEALLLGGASLPADLREQIEKALATFIEEQKIDEKEGANVVWAAWAKLVTGLYFENVVYVQAAYELMSEATNQGQHNHITDDWAYFFHLHILNMHYGGQHFGAFVDYLKFSDGTSLSLANRPLPNDPRHRTSITVCLDWLKNFLQWIYYRDGLADPFTAAKFPHGQSTYGGRILSGATRLGQTSYGKDEPYRSMIANLVSGGAQPIGARAYPTARYLVSRRNNFYASLMLVNLAEPHLEAATFAPIFGAVNIVDPASYKKWESDNILQQPQMLLNAMTMPMIYEDATYELNPRGHSGREHLFELTGMLKNWGYYGVSTLAGHYGMGAEQLTGGDKEFALQRSWFFFDDEIVCLGSGLQAAQGAMQTVLYHVAAGGNYHSSRGNGALPLASAATNDLGTLAWLQHSGMGYFFPRPEPVVLQGMGAMSRVYIDHGNKPVDATFAAVLLPTFTQSQTESYAANPAIEVLQCDRVAHIVHHKETNVTGIAAFAPLQTEALAINLRGYVLYQNAHGKFHLSLYNPYLEEALANKLGNMQDNPMFDANVKSGNETYHSYKVEVPFRLRKGNDASMSALELRELANGRTEVQCNLRVYRKFEISGSVNAEGVVTLDKAWTGWNDAEMSAAPMAFVQNSDPVGEPGGPYVARAGDIINFDGTHSYDRDGGRIVQYQWRFGDGASATGESVSHRYNAVGVYEASLAVTDDEGMKSEEKFAVTIQPQPSAGENIRVRISGDDQYEVYVNGARMGANNSWPMSEEYTAPLQAGKNVVAVKAENWDQAGAVLAEVIAQGQVWPSNATWKISLAEEPGWQQVTFDDSRWRAATSQGVHGTALPWAQFQNVSGIAANAGVQWIWSADKWRDHVVYMRFTVPRGVDRTAPFTPSGFRIEAQKR